MQTLMYSLSDNQLMPPSQEQIAMAQQSMFAYQESAASLTNPEIDEEIRAKSSMLASLLRQDKEQAKIKIDELVSSARQMTSQLTHSLTSVPVHPYQRLLYDYLGPDFICPSIDDLTIPQDFNPARCLTQLENIANNVSELQLSQYAVLSAEAMKPSFNGTISDNLNNAFAVLSSTASGDRFVVDDIKLKQHLTFAETVKNIPTDYVLKNPILVAKKILAEFTKIHHKADSISEKVKVSEKVSKEPLLDNVAVNSTKSLQDMVFDYDMHNQAEDPNYVPLTKRSAERSMERLSS
jgi:hypothetical protein